MSKAKTAKEVWIEKDGACVRFDLSHSKPQVFHVLLIGGKVEIYAPRRLVINSKDEGVKVTA